MCPLPSFSQWKHLAHLQYSIKTRVLTLTESRYRTSDFHHYKNPSCCTAHFPPLTSNSSLTPSHHKFVFHFHFVISKMLHKQNHIVCKLCGLAFFTQHNFLEGHPGCFIDSSLLLATQQYSVVWMRPTLTIHSLKDIWLISIFGYYE